MADDDDVWNIETCSKNWKENILYIIMIQLLYSPLQEHNTMILARAWTYRSLQNNE